MDIEWGEITKEPQTTLTEARRLLGRKYNHLSDLQVQDIIITLTLLARYTLEIEGS